MYNKKFDSDHWEGAEVLHLMSGALPRLLSVDDLVTHNFVSAKKANKEEFVERIQNFYACEFTSQGEYTVAKVLAIKHVCVQNNIHPENVDYRNSLTSVP